MNKKTPSLEKNNDVSLNASIVAYQTALNGYKRAINDYLKYIFVNDNGIFCIIDGYEKRAQNITQYIDALQKSKVDTEYYRRAE